MMEPAVTSQPGRELEKGQHTVTPVYVSPKGVTVRTMVADDCDFVGTVLVEAFKDKLTHAAGTENLPVAKQALAEDHKSWNFKYHRIFIAEFEGQRAGAMEIKFRGDRNTNEVSNHWNTLGCWPLCRLGCMAMTMDEKIKEGHCYVEHVGVDERFRGRGVGGALMKVADQQARARGCHILYLLVASDNRAQNLYSREGFQTTGSVTYCGLSYCITGRRRFLKMEKRLQIETKDDRHNPERV